MAGYHISISKPAQNNSTDYRIVLQIVKLTRFLIWLTNHAPTDVRPKGREGFRIRVGDYRVIYEILESVLVVEVVSLGNRKAIYKS